MIRQTLLKNNGLRMLVIIGITFPMLVGCGQLNEEALPAAISETAVETATTMEETKDMVSDATTSISGIDAISNSAIGESVTFGSYEQDKNHIQKVMNWCRIHLIIFTWVMLTMVT